MMVNKSKCDVAGTDASGPARQTAFPVKISPNKRHFVDQKGRAVFWLGTTQWQLFRDFSLDEVRIILEKTRSHGFSFVQAMLMGTGDGTVPNVRGQKPWINDDPLTPNEAYFTAVDSVLRLAIENSLVVSMTLYHQRYRPHITLAKARPWARWVAQRYKDVPNIVWSMTPRAEQEYVPVLRELAAGLREGDEGRHIVTFKPDPSPHSSSFLHTEDWLDFNSMQTWKDVALICPFVARDYNLAPVKPVLMAEGAYEAGSEYGFDVTALWVRRQAYYSYLTGGHHTYGHNDSWRVLPTWKEALDSPGAVQMGILKRVFLARSEWWNLVPDQSVFATGGQTSGDLLHLAARHADGRWVMIYLADKASFSVNMNKVASATASVCWINPRTGNSQPVGTFATTGVEEFSTPDGWEDALLVLEAAKGK